MSDECPQCGDEDAPATSHYAPFCDLYCKERFQEETSEQSRREFESDN